MLTKNEIGPTLYCRTVAGVSVAAAVYPFHFIASLPTYPALRKFEMNEYEGMDTKHDHSKGFVSSEVLSRPNLRTGPTFLRVLTIFKC